ncbi:MAG: PEP-CTERM sorting domain-containing protein [Verrucomicrobiaceae bacterium]|nr:MAG: PEP-CTERM sorting domain-containing protein [Verrucomicrobiaceae bacterium]
MGNWITSGVETLTLSVRHNNATKLDFYLRIAASAPPGAGASLTTGFSIAPNTWTDVTIPIVNSTSSFSSYGAGDFNTVFAGVQNIQFGFYLPEGTYTNLTMDIDNVGVTVPEPSAALMGCAALGLAFIRRRRA